MLIHITPKLYRPAGLAYFEQCTLSKVYIPELELTLINGTDIDTRKPYPNKNYFVGCRKKGRKAIDGLLIESSTQLNSFTVCSEWLLPEGRTVEHQVNYQILDNEYDMVSDAMIMWDDRIPSNMKHTSPENRKEFSPLKLQPKMDLLPGDRGGDFEDEQFSDGIISKRVETFTMPTIQKERFESFADYGRYPDASLTIFSKEHNKK